jgi:tetratricopeptide (TPR) repeat protein
MQFRGFALALICALFSSSLWAMPPAVAAQSDTGSDTDARSLFEQGRVAYDAGHFDEAVRAFRRAYVLSPRFPLLYNIGQAELRAGHDSLALDAFEGFLRQAPADDGRRSEVEERIRVLRAMGTAAPSTEEVHEATVTETQTETTTQTGTETETTVTTPVEPPPASNGGGAGVVPWIIVGVGGALAIAGAVLMGVGASDASRVTGATHTDHWSDLMGAANDANTLWGVGIGLLITGVVAVGAGVVWAVVGGGGSSDSPSARLRLLPGGLSLEGAF